MKVQTEVREKRTAVYERGRSRFIDAPQGATIIMKNCTFHERNASGRPITRTVNAVIQGGQVMGDTVPIRNFDSLQYNFDGTEVSVTQVLHQSLRGVTTLVAEIEKYL
jgi:hypothetical protein